MKFGQVKFIFTAEKCELANNSMCLTEVLLGLDLMDQLPFFFIEIKHLIYICHTCLVLILFFEGLTIIYH